MKKLRLPLAGQILILTLAAVLVAQAMTVIAVMIAPPPGPPRYTIEAVARGFHGIKVERHERALRQRSTTTLPPDFARSNPWDAPTAADLARALGVPADAVRFHRRGPPMSSMATMGPGRPRPRPRDWPKPPPGEFGRHERRIGEFVAAWRQADGTWLIVQPAPEREWMRRIVIWLLGGALVMGPVAYLFARGLTRPIRRFAETAERVGRDPKAPLIPLDGPAEIGLAAEAFNRMQQRLQLYVSDRVGMMSAISHDLRTPLTRIRLKVEKATPELKQSVLNDVRQMEAMITAVLAFTQDADRAVPRERLDLTSLVACAVDDLAETGAPVEMQEAGPLLVHGDPIALRRLIDNLIDNAVKYGGGTQVSIREQAGEAIVEIADQGPGLSEPELRRVFDPFYRSEAAREKTSNGMGLGLAIARSVARAHGGDVRLRNAEPGLIAEAILPLARPEA
jgi:two-component system OmpR family sensor kinase